VFYTVITQTSFHCKGRWM